MSGEQTISKARRPAASCSASSKISARVSHQLSTAAAYLPVSAALRFEKWAQRTVKYAWAHFPRTPCIRKHLRTLATTADEKHGLGLRRLAAKFLQGATHFTYNAGSILNVMTNGNITRVIIRKPHLTLGILPNERFHR